MRLSLLWHLISFQLPVSSFQFERQRRGLKNIETRAHVHEERFNATAEEMFALLVTPSAIRQWWGAARVIVLPELNGTWAAAWGENEDDPDYISTAVLVAFDPPRKLAMKYGKYFAKSGPLPFEFADDSLTTFDIEALDDGCVLRVEQTGFPTDPVADDFFAACQTGWETTFEGIRNYLADTRSE